MIKRLSQFIVSLFVFSQITGCVNYNRESGVENLWRKNHEFIKGQTTSSEILAKLGPPSQVMNLGDKTIFYYMREAVSGEGIILLVYNNNKEITSYDRAMFIFTKEHKLEDYAYSKHDNE